MAEPAEGMNEEGEIEPREVFALLEKRDWDNPRLAPERYASAIAWALENVRADPANWPAPSELVTRVIGDAMSAFRRQTGDAVLACLVRVGPDVQDDTAALLHDAWMEDHAFGRWVETLPDHPEAASAPDWANRAYVLSLATGHQGSIHTRHLVAALLAPEPVGDSGLRQDLRSIGVLADQVCAQLGAALNARPIIDPPGFWGAIFRLPPAEAAPEPGKPAPELVAGVRSDAVDGADLPDHLNIEADVNALASIVAACSVEPPLAIGLFGDWGAGKSFFMGKMEKRLRELCARAPATDHQGRPYYFRNIAQIRFNAWHYADSNLWASLITRIFEGLSLYGVEKGQEDVRERLREQLRSAELMLGDAEGRLATAEARRQQAELHTRDVQRREREVEQKVLQRVGRSTLQDMAETIAQRIGAKWPELGPAEILRVQAELKTTGGKIKELWQWLRDGGRPRTALMVLVMAIPVIAVVALQLLPSLRERFQPDAVSRAISAAAGFLIAVMGWISTYWPKLGGVLKKLGEAKAEIDRADAEVTAAGERSLASLVEEEQRARGVAREAEAEVERVRKELKKAQPSQRLTDFLQERSQSSDYRRHLGLVSLIRNDLSMLSDLLRSARAGGDHDTGLPAIDRIVLYIDDLDRCPEDRVVQVLEAIHLLLAFPLFVVVVGVDSRWLLHSLRKRYRAFSATGAATPQAYLEKIFQIPFTLRRMGETGFGRFMDFLLPASAAPPPAAGKAPAVAQGGPPQGQPPAAAAQAAPAPPPSPVPSPPLPPAPEPRPELLQLTKDEVELIKRAWPLIPTPRAANRLANCYRLLRVRIAEDRKAAFFGRAHGRPAEHPLVIVLLAGLIGFPAEFSALLGLAADRTVTASADTWKRFREALAGRPSLEPLHRALGRLKLPEADPVPMEAVRYWLAVVCRFSFHLRDEALGSEQLQA